MTTARARTPALFMGVFVVAAFSVGTGTTWAGEPPAPPWFAWSTVVNNNDLMPFDSKARTFNSYNQPSVNVNGFVVIRARSKGGEGGPGGEGGNGGEAGQGGPGGPGGQGEQGQGQPTHGIYVRDMLDPASSIVRILDRKSEVPQPNNLGTKFVETPSFPRIDMRANVIATRGNHQPLWRYIVGADPDTGENIETRAGTTGIYTNPFGSLITGASKLGAVPDFDFLAVPGLDPPTPFDVFPGSPAVTGGDTIVFKGNYTVGGEGKTGVFYRTLVNAPILAGNSDPLTPAGGNLSVVLIADNTKTKIPGTDTEFGSTSPPSAADGQVVFAGFDDEEKPTLGGLYLAPLSPEPDLAELVRIGGPVPGEGAKRTFNALGEGGAFDGRYVAFWGAWGAETRTVRLYCPTEGNKDRIAYCNRTLVCEGTKEVLGDESSRCDDGPRCYQDKQVPVNQGFFVHDTIGGGTRTVAKTGARFDEFVFWNYSGKTPCVGSGGHGEEGAEDDGEPARWRSSAFVAVSGLDTAFKAVRGGVVGIYLNRQPGQDVVTVLDTKTDGQSVDPEAPAGSKVTEVGLEREGLRGDWLAINAKMGIEGGTEEDGMAGIYVTRIPR